MVCCDCDDDCQDKMKCACWQLSIQHTDAAPGMKGKRIKYKISPLNLIPYMIEILFSMLYTLRTN